MKAGRMRVSLLLLLTLTFLPTRGADRPNVLFIAADDLNTALGCYGSVIAKTPHLDRLAVSGVCFERAYHQIPLCNPARASVMTGLRPDRTGVYDLSRHFRETLPEVVTLPQRFAEAGYFTARVGKIFHYDVPADIGTDGFDDAPSWQLTVNPKGRDKDEEALVFNAEPHRKISASLSWHAADGTDEEQTDGLIATEAIRLMKKHRDGPFFLGVGFFRPHTPYVAPKHWFDLHPLESMRLPYAPDDDRADLPAASFAHNNPVPGYGLDEETLRRALQAYHACVSFVDAQVGRLLAALDEFGLADNTIVVFWSDHGYHLGEHGGIWQKRTLFEEATRAPLLLRVPGMPGNGVPCRRVVEFVDVYPTLLAAAGLAVPQDLDGRSLVPLLRDPLTDWEGGAVSQILRPVDERLPGPVMGRSVRTERWRFTEWNGGAAGMELYDHAADPQEFENLAIDPSPETMRIIGELRAAFGNRAAATVPATPYDPARL
jgi:uncharacterized sulfatase